MFLTKKPANDEDDSDDVGLLVMIVMMMTMLTMVMIMMKMAMTWKSLPMTRRAKLEVKGSATIII